MSKFIGKSAVISLPDKLWTHGKDCTIIEYVRDTRKYEVEFDNGWCGWYHRRELIIEE